MVVALRNVIRTDAAHLLASIRVPEAPRERLGTQSVPATPGGGHRGPLSRCSTSHSVIQEKFNDLPDNERQEVQQVLIAKWKFFADTGRDQGHKDAFYKGNFFWRDGAQLEWLGSPVSEPSPGEEPALKVEPILAWVMKRSICLTAASWMNGYHIRIILGEPLRPSRDEPPVPPLTKIRKAQRTTPFELPKLRGPDSEAPSTARRRLQLPTYDESTPESA